MKKLFVSALAALCAITAANAQKYHDNATGRQFYVELGGPGVLFSASFDSRFEHHAVTGWGYRVGLGFATTSEGIYYTEPGGGGSGYWEDHVRTYVTIPLGINYVFGRSDSPHAFEVGGGVTVLTRKVDLYNYSDRDTEGNVIGHFSFMYRKQPIGGGFTWRIGFTPIIGTAGSIMPSAAVGVGYSF